MNRIPQPVSILHVINGLYTGGAERMLVKLLAKMDRQRFANSVVSLIAGGELAEPLRELGISVTELGITMRGGGWIGGLKRLAEIVRNARPAVIQGWMYHGNLAALIAGWLNSHRLVLWNIRCSDMQDGHGSLAARLIKFMSAKLSHRPEAVIVNAFAGKAYHEEIGYRPRRWEIIPNGFDPDVFRPDTVAKTALRRELGIANNAILIGMIARYNPMKDHPNFIAAAGNSAKQYPRAHFVMGGLGVTRDNGALTRLMGQTGFAERFHLLGQCNEVEQIMPGLDIVVQSSAFGEGFPNMLGEAMACGVPCVATDVGDARRIIGDTGKIAPSRDPQALAIAIGELINMAPEARRELGEKARRRINENYSLSAVVQRYEDLYAEIIRR